MHVDPTGPGTYLMFLASRRAGRCYLGLWFGPWLLPFAVSSVGGSAYAPVLRVLALYGAVSIPLFVLLWLVCGGASQLWRIAHAAKRPRIVAGGVVAGSLLLAALGIIGSSALAHPLIHAWPRLAAGYGLVVLLTVWCGVHAHGSRFMLPDMPTHEPASAAGHATKGTHND